MKLYYGKSGRIIGFSRNNVTLPGASISIPDKEMPSDFRRLMMSGMYKVEGKKLIKGKSPKDHAKHLEELVKCVDETLQIRPPQGKPEEISRPKSNRTKTTK
ncbi:MAG TPA: hypothetical protein ENI97_07465 [Gammaproteobacteria bacterium]|nr:hypothetical protein [Gammaproteobacteria bacterium]